MFDLFHQVISNQLFLIIGAYVGVVFSVILLALFFVKTSRDERGRAIIGRASIFSMIAFIILMNVLAKSLDRIDINYLTLANCIQWIYNIVIIIESVAIMILKYLQ